MSWIIGDAQLSLSVSTARRGGDNVKKSEEGGPERKGRTRNMPNSVSDGGDLSSWVSPPSNAAFTLAAVDSCAALVRSYARIKWVVVVQHAAKAKERTRDDGKTNRSGFLTTTGHGSQ